MGVIFPSFGRVPEYGPFRPKHSARSAVKSPPQAKKILGERPLATALPVLRLHVAIFDFGYGSLKTPLKKGCVERDVGLNGPPQFLVY
jgi:hypothetical protein